MSVKRGSFHVKLLRWRSWAPGFQPGQIPQVQAQLARLVFSMNEAWRQRKDSVKNISLKTKECYWYEGKHPHAWLSGVSVSHPRTWHWDPWPIREAGLWKSRNLGIGFWQRARWHGDMRLQLSWTWMTWVCYWGEILDMHTHAHICALGHNHHVSVSKFLEHKNPVIIWSAKIKHKAY